MQVFYATRSVLPLPPGHRFPMAKYQLLRDRLPVEVAGIELTQAEPASSGELALVHQPAYIQAISNGTIGAGAMREIGLPWSEAMVDRTRRSVGATIAAARVALREGVAANIAGGTHHAASDKGSGFCVFNDAAVAARLMQAERGRAPDPAGTGAREPLQVAVIDLDVHQGNGTASIFAGDPSVFTLSIHGEKNFPFRKVAGDLDIGLPDGTGDPAYLDALDLALVELDSRFRPDAVFYLAGADPHEGDRLGRLALSYDGLLARDRRVFDWAWSRRLPLALSMGGGYGRDIGTTVQVQLNTFGVALQYWRRWQNTVR